MVASAEAGELVDRGEGPFSLAEMQAWGEERTVRVTVLRHLLVGAQWPVDAKGVSLRGVRIRGHLDLEGATLRCPLALDCCYLDATDPASLDQATAKRITLTRCHLPGLTGDMLTVRELDLSGSSLTGSLSLSRADIGGQLICSGATLSGTDHARCSLIADGLKTGGDVYLDKGFTADWVVTLRDADIGGLSCNDATLNGPIGGVLVADRLKTRGDVRLALTADGAVRLPGADIGGQLICSGAKLNGFDTDARALVADNLKTGGDVFLDEGFTADGTVRLNGADIGGQLICSGAKLSCVETHGYALAADRLKTRGDVYLDKGFTADGAVRLMEADIGGRLICRGAVLTGTDPYGYALAAENLRTCGHVFLDNGFTAHGAVRLNGADIGGQLQFRGATLAGSDHGGRALVANNLKTPGDVYLDKGFTADGAVMLTGADIGGQLACSGAKLTGAHGALAADRLKTSGNVLLDGNFTATGVISLFAACVGGSVVLEPAALADSFAFTATDARIEGELRWAPSSQVSGLVNLEGSKVGQLGDDWARERGKANGYWPPAGRLHLDGFTYGRFGGDHQATVTQRLDWIRSQYRPADRGWVGFATQPYEQLAAVYRQAGQDAEARKAAIARRVDLRKYGNVHLYRWLGNWLVDKTIKYGYQSWRAGMGLALLYGAIWLLATIAQHTHGIFPVGNVKGLHPVPSATTCTSNYPCFAPAGYAIDVVIPIINVHQAQYWGPNGHTWGYAWVTAIWMATVLGWTLATLLVAGLTGLTRRGD